MRFIGNDLHPTDFTRAKSWAAKLKRWKELGLNRFFFMVHEPDDIKTPEMAGWIVAELNKTCGAALNALSKPSPTQKTLDLR